MARMMKLVLNGQEYRCPAASVAALTIKEARAIKANTDMSIMAWETAITKDLHQMDPDVFLAMAYLLCTRSGAMFDWSSLDDMLALNLVQAFSTEDVPDKADETKTDVPTGSGTPPVAEVKSVKNGRAKQPASATG